ncbi:GNAT family N-acetyltransferase [Butyrivibrio sp. XB500-5]|uniref:GNAT family N-acetyltransferase n=1 Tax=Butyrivibrio sp. XB500-5 TaxID=2364880 RepID=UPI000EAA6942|nr:GNAT family N-acetyltransferase [Butyrivibrio sp. XB500-5]RKM60264.1 GNAT family N-acetyltransferase [Butyrivibrio sp. XB500-5]
MNYREIEKKDNKKIAALIRTSLKSFGLDIPGTAYYDEGLDHFSELYGTDDSKYFVILDEFDNVIGGVGFSKFSPMKDTAELQKLYLDDCAKGKGLGYEMMKLAEDKMREAGYKFSYLETHSNLQAAVHLYEKCGYTEIERPEEVGHSTMDRFFMKKL